MSQNKALYRIIVKVGNDDFKKWHTSKIPSFLAFLDSNYPKWRWANVYDSQTGEQIGSLTKTKRHL